MTNLAGYLKKISWTLFSLFLSFLLFQTHLSNSYSQSSIVDINNSSEIIYTLEDDSLKVEVITTFENAEFPNLFVNKIKSNIIHDNYTNFDVIIEPNIFHEINKLDEDLEFEVDFQGLNLSKGEKVIQRYSYMVEDFKFQKLLKLPTQLNYSRVEKVIVNIPETQDSYSTFPSSQVINSGDSKQSLLFDNPTTQEITIFEVDSLGYEITHEINTQSPLINIANDDQRQNLYLSTQLDNNSEVLNQEGNYSLKPNEDLDQFQYYLDINPNPRRLTRSEILGKYTEPSVYWDISDTQILNDFEMDLKEITEGSNSIYDLSTDKREKIYELVRVTVSENLAISDFNNIVLNSGRRNGAKAALSSNTDNTPEDYADLTIALLREAGIPSQLAVGYYANNFGYFDQPFFHNWVEVFDKDRGQFVMDTFQNDIYSDREPQDFEYIKFVTRVSNAVFPRLSTDTIASIKVSPVYGTFKRNFRYEIRQKEIETNISELDFTTDYFINNTGNTIITSINGENKNLLPGQSTTISVNNLKDRDQFNLIEIQSFSKTSEVTELEIQYEETKFWWWDVLFWSIAIIIVLIIYRVYISSVNIFSKS